MGKRKTGFTLIEIMVAIFVLLVGMVGILALFPRGIRETKAAVEETQAALVAQSAYNALRSSIKQMTNADLYFFYDGMHPRRAYDMRPVALADGNSYGIPAHDTETLSPPLPLSPPFPDPPDLSGEACATTAYAADPRNGVDGTPINEFKSYCQLAKGVVVAGDERFNVGYGTTFTQDDSDQLRQYSFNIQLSAVAGNPDGLFDVAIHVRRGASAYGKIVRSFYTQVNIPIN